jgi:hypothetical protein
MKARLVIAAVLLTAISWSGVALANLTVGDATTPSKLWYRLRIDYRGFAKIKTSTNQPGTQAEPGIDLDTEQLYGVEATLRSKTALLLIRGPGRTFSIRAGRELTGDLELWSARGTENQPACNTYEWSQRGTKLGSVSATIGARPENGSVLVKIGGGAHPSGNPSDMWGEVKQYVTIKGGVQCDLDTARSRNIKTTYCCDHYVVLPSGSSLGVGATDPQTVRSTKQIEPPLRPGDAIPIPELTDNDMLLKFAGLRFGARTFARKAGIDYTYRQPLRNGVSGKWDMFENWVFTFTRCPGTSAC